MFFQTLATRALPLSLFAGLALASACDKNAGASATQPEEPAASAPAASPPAAQAVSQEQGQPIAASAPMPHSAGLEDGAACQSNDECASGTCEGEGCGEGATGTCMPKDRPCTYDLVPYCACDGSTFQSSSVCPGRRYASKGACQAPEGDS